MLCSACSIVSAVLSQWTFLLAVVAYFAWRRIMSPYTFFADRGVAFKKPLPILGNFGKMALKLESIFDLVVNPYNEFKGKRFFGIFDFSRPLLVIRDPELIRQVTVKDFDYFADHRPFFSDSNAEPLFGKSLFMLRGQRWRDMRSTLSPAFTGSKMRQMFQLVVNCAEETTNMLLLQAKQSEGPFVPEMKDLFTRFTNDVIASSAFGIQVNSQKDRNNEFFRMGKMATNFSGFRIMFNVFMISLLPRLSSLLGIRMFNNTLAKFYHSLVHDTIRHREQNNIIRPDMIHLLMEARKGVLKSENSASNAASGGTTAADGAGFATVAEVDDDALNGKQKVKWDDDDLTAQCFLFFLAGFDTSSLLLCFTAHELMENPDVQRRLIEELDGVKEQLAGKPLTYDMLQKMTYLDMVVSESLRKWPPAGAMDRECQKTYRMTDENGHTVTLEKGDAIWIPAFGIHRDEQYYPEPDRFDPERFSEERKGDIKPFTYMPFGSGPRNCIGSRFALMECKAFLFYLLTNFTFEVAATSTVPLVLAPNGFSLKPKNGFNINLKHRL